ncbi:protein of unassigned function [Methylobacterium oryzae CBMB20]|uniref:Protein of unassigned function n=1 Tax=Methylobacterium oryzae CBMB20 TaxID=693986 RepID=A0A089P1B7_9HYPH|nr:protein of unassigned function [Methylobacterium oryzae CBMB20]
MRVVSTAAKKISLRRSVRSLGALSLIGGLGPEGGVSGVSDMRGDVQPPGRKSILRAPDHEKRTEH